MWFQDHQDSTGRRRNPDDPFNWEARFVILQ